MSGVLYSLVALGLVLIFKASGVFNFAQGAMVLFAALAVARMSEVMPLPVAFVSGDRRDGGAGVGDRAPGVAASGQPGRSGAADGHPGSCVFSRRLRADHVGQRHLSSIDTGLPKTPVLVAENIFQGGILINTEDLVPQQRRRCWCSLSRSFFPENADGRALCGQWPMIIRPRSQSAFR